MIRRVGQGAERAVPTRGSMVARFALPTLPSSRRKRGARHGGPLPARRRRRREALGADDAEFLGRAERHLPAPAAQETSRLLDHAVQRGLECDAARAPQPDDARTGARLLLAVEMTIESAVSEVR